MKTNYHTHTLLCNHAVGSVEDYIKEAINNKFDIIGISDHARIPSYIMSENDYTSEHLDTYMTELEFNNIYLKDIRMCQKKYTNIKIYVSLEIDYNNLLHSHYEYLLGILDYLVLGIHHFFADGKKYNSYYDLNEDNVILYAKTIENALSTGYFKYLAHPDLFLYSINNPSKNCEIASKMIIESCIKNGCYLEINCNGYPHYPTYFFYNIASKYKGTKFILGYDAHNPKLLKGEHIKPITDLITKLGLKLEEKLDFLD
ncbi:MAG: PHP domain-containing protein [Acholeplasmatales bacterium]|jgi:histidinol-phosphatase (PHP family)|nr:PHP domain-containing protein [Acholeplasmatales bacterium]